MHEVAPLTPRQFWARYDATERRVRESAPLLPSYAVAGWSGPVMTGDWEWEGGELVRAGLVHGDPDGAMIQVLTTRHARDARASAQNLRTSAAVAQQGGYEPDRVRRALARHASGSVRIAVESEQADLATWADGDRWWAAGEHAGHGIALEARQVDPAGIALAMIANIEAYLTGYRAYLRARRGESAQ